MDLEPELERGVAGSVGGQHCFALLLGVLSVGARLLQSALAGAVGLAEGSASSRSLGERAA